MIKRLAPLCLLLIVTLPLLISSSLSTPAAVAVVEQTSGPAWVIRADQTYPLQSGMALLVKDKVKTGQQATAQLKFCDHHLVQMGPGASLILSELEKGDATESVSIYLEIGELLIDVWNKLQSGLGFKVESQAGIAGVRGTRFTVTVDDTGAMEVAVEEGLVELMGRSDGNRVLLGAGQQSAVAPGGSPSKPQKAGQKPSNPNKGKGNNSSGNSNNGGGNGGGNGNGYGQGKHKGGNPN